MANRWGNSRNNGWLYFSGLKNHCRWWLQPWNLKMLTPWKESYDQLRQHIKKQRHYFADKRPSTQSYGFSSGHLLMRDLDHKERWVPKNWCFQTVVLGKTLGVLWTAWRSDQVILEEISPEYSLEELMLNLKLQYFGHLMQRTESFEKTLVLGKIESGRRSGWQRMRWLDGITTQWTWVWVNSRSWWWIGKPSVLQSME